MFLHPPKWHPTIPGGFPVSTPWRPSTEVGDVLIHHAAPKVWIPATVVQSGDLVGETADSPKTTRDAALTVAHRLLQPGRCIYIHHRDDAEHAASGLLHAGSFVIDCATVIAKFLLTESIRTPGSR